MSSYFERNGAHKCPDDANPAEWMLEVIGAAPGTTTDIDWHDAWRNSPEYQEVQRELDYMKNERPKEMPPRTDSNDKESYRQFAAPIGVQFWEVTQRVFQQYWRTPSYIYSKIALCIGSSIFIGMLDQAAMSPREPLADSLGRVYLLQCPAHASRVAKSDVSHSKVTRVADVKLASFSSA